jgi:hypothetical protein
VSPLVWVDLLVVGLAAGLSVACVRAGGSRSAARYLLLLCAASALYAAAQIGYQVAGEPHHKLFFSRLGYAGAFLLLPVMLNLPAAVLGRPLPPSGVQRALLLIVAGFVSMSYSDMMFGIDPVTGQIGRAGWMFALALPFFLLGTLHYVGTFATELLAHPDAVMRNRVGWLLLGTAAFVAASIPDLMRRTAIADPFGEPVAAAGVLVFLSSTAYAVLRHHLIDVELVISRGIVYSALIPILALAYVATGEALEQGTQKVIPAGSMAGGIIAALVVATVFEPTKRWLHLRVDCWFIRDRELVDRLRRLERASRFVVAEDVEGLRGLAGDLATVIAAVERRATGGRAGG